MNDVICSLNGTFRGLYATVSELPSNDANNSYVKNTHNAQKSIRVPVDAAVKILVSSYKIQDDLRPLKLAWAERRCSS